MPRAPSFRFGANRHKTKAGGKKSAKGRKGGGGNKSNKWRSYVSSNAPIPD